jgi:hypothetical protein
MNHYHWLLDIIPRLQVQPLSPVAFAGTVLMSPTTSVAQQDMLMRLLRANLSVLSLAGGHAIQVESLSFTPNLVGYGSLLIQVSGRFSTSCGNFWESMKLQFAVSMLPEKIARIDCSQTKMG